MNKKITAITVAIVTVILSACGGGSSSPTASTTPPAGVNPAPAPNPVPAPAPVPPSLVTSVPTPTYAAGSNELAFFNGLNSFRASLGLGLYTQNAKLDLSSKNHAAYIAKYANYNPGGTIDMSAVNATTGLLNAHSEDALPGATGATPIDRARAAMYATDYVSEDGSFGSAAQALASVINTVFHRYSLMEQVQRDIGIAFSNDSLNSSVITLSTPQGVAGQSVADDFTAIYPADKQTSVPLVSELEAPNPFSDITYGDYATKTTSAISLMSKQFTTLAVVSFTVTEAGQTTPLPVRLLTQSTNATTQKYLGPNVAVIAGYAPFKSQTVYNVVFVGTVNGVPVAKNWSFTTA